jgi:UPF0042 nucleotide-binding protein
VKRRAVAVKERRRTPRSLAASRGRGRFVVVTGLSGSGKSQAIRALEDLGYFCVDNLPTTLIPTFARLVQQPGMEIPKAAVVVDVREGALLRRFPAVYRKLRAMKGINAVLIFLEAGDAALVRRFSETRRPHPLAPGKSALEGIRAEREELKSIRKMADQILDTSHMTVHELRQAFIGLSRGRTERTPLVVTLLSFGFKHGVPTDADLVLDVRFLPNPHFVPGLRQRTGRDRAVVRYMHRSPATKEFLERTTSLLTFLLPQYIQEGKSYLTIAIGCTGGSHRSVAIAEELRRALSGVKGLRLRVKHRDIAGS